MLGSSILSWSVCRLAFVVIARSMPGHLRRLSEEGHPEWVYAFSFTVAPHESYLLISTDRSIAFMYEESKVWCLFALCLVSGVFFGSCVRKVFLCLPRMICYLLLHRSQFVAGFGTICSASVSTSVPDFCGVCDGVPQGSLLCA